jgi:hypothetical protein
MESTAYELTGFYLIDDKGNGTSVFVLARMIASTLGWDRRYLLPEGIANPSITADVD